MSSNVKLGRWWGSRSLEQIGVTSVARQGICERHDFADVLVDDIDKAHEVGGLCTSLGSVPRWGRLHVVPLLIAHVGAIGGEVLEKQLGGNSAKTRRVLCWDAWCPPKCHGEVVFSLQRTAQECIEIPNLPYVVWGLRQ